MPSPNLPPPNPVQFHIDIGISPNTNISELSKFYFKFKLSEKEYQSPLLNQQKNKCALHLDTKLDIEELIYIYEHGISVEIWKKEELKKQKSELNTKKSESQTFLVSLLSLTNKTHITKANSNKEIEFDYDIPPQPHHYQHPLKHLYHDFGMTERPKTVHVSTYKKEKKLKSRVQSAPQRDTRKKAFSTSQLLHSFTIDFNAAFNDEKGIEFQLSPSSNDFSLYDFISKINIKVNLNTPLLSTTQKEYLKPIVIQIPKSQYDCIFRISNTKISFKSQKLKTDKFVILLNPWKEILLRKGIEVEIKTKEKSKGQIVSVSLLEILLSKKQESVLKLPIRQNSRPKSRNYYSTMELNILQLKVESLYSLAHEEIEQTLKKGRSVERKRSKAELTVDSDDEEIAMEKSMIVLNQYRSVSTSRASSASGRTHSSGSAHRTTTRLTTSPNTPTIFNKVVVYSKSLSSVNQLLQYIYHHNMTCLQLTPSQQIDQSLYTAYKTSPDQRRMHWDWISGTHLYDTSNHFLLLEAIPQIISKLQQHIKELGLIQMNGLSTQKRIFIHDYDLLIATYRFKKSIDEMLKDGKFYTRKTKTVYEAIMVLQQISQGKAFEQVYFCGYHLKYLLKGNYIVPMT